MIFEKDGEETMKSLKATIMKLFPLPPWMSLWADFTVMAEAPTGSLAGTPSSPELLPSVFKDQLFHLFNIGL